MKTIKKYLLLLSAIFAMAACSSSDDTTTTTAPTLSETEVNVEADATFYSLTVSSRTLWTATVESGSEWLTLISGKGSGGASEKLSFEMKKNTTITMNTSTIIMSTSTIITSIR